MGMDISGLNPISPKGKYFRANVWSWRPIHALIALANGINGGKLVPAATLQSMWYNDGAGLKDQVACNALAGALDHLLAHPAIIKEHGIEIVDRKGQGCVAFPITAEIPVCDGEGHFLAGKERRAAFAAKTARSAYEVEFDHIAEFVTFLRNCGGFEVW